METLCRERVDGFLEVAHTSTVVHEGCCGSTGGGDATTTATTVNLVYSHIHEHTHTHTFSYKRICMQYIHTQNTLTQIHFTTLNARHGFHHTHTPFTRRGWLVVQGPPAAAPICQKWSCVSPRSGPASLSWVGSRHGREADT